VINVSIIVINYNTKEYTKNCIDSIIRYTKDISFEIILIDNGSDESIDDLIPLFKTHPVIIKYFKNDKNLGFAAANNEAANIATGRYIFLLNNDTILYENTIKILHENILSGSKGTIISPIIKYFDKKDKIWFAGRRINLSIGKTYPIDPEGKVKTQYITGCALMISKVLYMKMGGFDEKYFCYYEDTDLSMRLLKEGGSLEIVTSTAIYHKVSASAGGENHSPWKIYYKTRNRFYFIRKFNKYYYFNYLLLLSLNFKFLSGEIIKRRNLKCAMAIITGIRDYFFGRMGHTR